jgi:hypothetical protein
MSTHAILAEFTDPGALLSAARAVKDAGYRKYDTYTPFPVHGMDDAMGLGRSPVGFIVGMMCLVGAAIGFSLQTWVAVDAYPLVISGKPLFSYQAFVVVTFALFVLFGTFGAVFGMLRLNKLPRLHHPLFESDLFRKATDDGFLLAIEAGDPRFDEAATQAFLASLGATTIEIVRGE